LVNAAPPIAGSQLDVNLKKSKAKDADYFEMTTPDSEWKTCLEHAEKSVWEVENTS